MREVFSSYHLKRNARKNLAICLGAIGFASALLVTGAVSGVLVGPSGLFVFEVKHHRGLIFHRNGIWAQIKAGRGGSPYAGHLGDPSGQLSRNIRYLKDRLERAGLNTPWIQGAIVFTNPRSVLDIDGLRRIKAITPKNLRQIISARRTLSSEQAHGINACLSMSEK